MPETNFDGYWTVLFEKILLALVSIPQTRVRLVGDYIDDAANLTTVAITKMNERRLQSANAGESQPTNER